jgi:hypothetical protein
MIRSAGPFVVLLGMILGPALPVAAASQETPGNAPDTAVTEPTQPSAPVEKREEKSESEEAAEDTTAATCGYAAGVTDGLAEASRETPWGWGAAGCCAGTFCSCPGCLGVTAAAYLIQPDAHPRGCEDHAEYARGYQESYVKEKQKRNAIYAFGGGSIAVIIGIVLFFL